ncbi:MAG: prephenate dehydratase domain-containing protein, partial [Methanobacteriaceae archaeon]|nr:prephenate dehydratase domain-containing protein [Methanobacteriaceae archaeon]
MQNKVSFLGPNGTFTHEAASTISENLISYCSIQSVMESVVNGECDKGVVPIENSIEGSVTLTLDLLVHKFNLMIENEIIIPINHNLLVNDGVRIEDISDVYSHSQALAQCQPFLEKLNVKKHFTLSTAAAAKKVEG